MNKKIELNSTPRLCGADIINFFGIDHIDPMFTYPGNKQDILKIFARRLPDQDTYKGRIYDVFMGSGAFSLGIGFGCVVMNDLNSDVILAHQMIRDYPDEVIAELKQLKVEEAAFYEIRRRFNDRTHPLPDIKRAAYMIYLTKTCSTQGYRVNRKGRFNQSFGRRPSSVLMTACHAITDVSAFLNLPGVELRNMDFEECLADVRPGDLVYMDPPYIHAKDGYNATDFGAVGLRRLAKVCDDLTSQGVCVLVSNYDDALVRELFPESRYDIEVVSVRKGTRGKGDNAKNEVVIWNRVRV